VRKYLNDRKVPQLLLQSGISKFNDPKNYRGRCRPAELRHRGEGFRQAHPRRQAKGKVTILYQNDDFGKEYLAGLKEGLGARAKEMMWASRASSSPTRPSNRRSSTCAAPLRRAADRGDPEADGPGAAQGARSRLASAHADRLSRRSITRTYIPAGIEASKGAVSSSVFTDPSDPELQNDSDVKAYVAWMTSTIPRRQVRRPACRRLRRGQLMVELLKRCGKGLTAGA